GRFPADPGHHHAATPAGGTNGEFDLVRASGGLHHDVRPDAAGAQENLAAHVALRRVVGLGRARVYGTTSAAGLGFAHVQSGGTGTGTGPSTGTRTCDANAPSVASPTEPPLAQMWYSPWRHHRHTPHRRHGSTATRAPGSMPATGLPSATTVPLNSWPMVSGGCLPVSGCGWVRIRFGPCATSCKSVPHTPQTATSTRACPGPG